MIKHLVLAGLLTMGASAAYAQQPTTPPRAGDPQIAAMPSGADAKKLIGRNVKQLVNPHEHEEVDRMWSRMIGTREPVVGVRTTNPRRDGVEWIRGVRVSGSLDRRGRGSLTVSGPAAAAGTITFAGRSASGTLGGVPFKL